MVSICAQCWKHGNVLCDNLHLRQPSWYGRKRAIPGTAFAHDFILDLFCSSAIIVLAKGNPQDIENGLPSPHRNCRLSVIIGLRCFGPAAQMVEQRFPRARIALRNTFPVLRRIQSFPTQANPDSEQVALIRQLVCAALCADVSENKNLSIPSSLYRTRLQPAYLLTIIAI